MVPNEQNLKPIRSTSEAREKGRLGGLASGQARRARKTARACAEIYLAMPVSDMRAWNKMNRDGVQPDDIDNMMLLVAAMVKAGQGGNVSAFKAVLKLLGEDKADQAKDDATGVILIGEAQEGEP